MEGELQGNITRCLDCGFPIETWRHYTGKSLCEKCTPKCPECDHRADFHAEGYCADYQGEKRCKCKAMFNFSPEFNGDFTLRINYGKD